VDAAVARFGDHGTAVASPRTRLRASDVRQAGAHAGGALPPRGLSNGCRDLE
jgi:hypothetical protein